MIQVDRIGEVKKFRLARSVFGRGLYFTAAYFVDGLLIDTGCSYTVKELARSLEGNRVDLIVNTHSHEDHVAGNSAFKTLFGARILAHSDALPYLADPRKRRLHPYQIFMWGYPAASQGEPLGEFVQTKNHAFQVIHAPGHSPDHVCLYEPEHGWLFAGDAYVHGRDRTLRADYNVWEILSSLKRLVALEPKIIFPGSGTVRSNAAEALREKIEYLEQIADKVLELHARGVPERAINKRLFGREAFITYITLGHFSGTNLVRSFVRDKPGQV